MDLQKRTRSTTFRNASNKPLNPYRVTLTQLGSQTASCHTNSRITQRLLNLRMPFFDRFYLIYLGTSCQNLEEKYWVEDSGNVFEVVTGTEKTAHRPCRGLFYRVVFRKDLCFPSLVFPSSNTIAWFVVPLGARKVLRGPSRLYKWIWSSRAGPQPKRC